MKLDKFKKLRGNISTPNLPDNDYIRSLYNLPKKAHHTPILPIIGSIAASLILIVGITIWALIGRGVRNTNISDDTQIIAPSDDGDDKQKPDNKDQNSNSKKPSDKNDQKPDSEQDKKGDQPDDDENDGLDNESTLPEDDKNEDNKTTLPENDENDSSNAAVPDDKNEGGSGSVTEQTPSVSDNSSNAADRKASADRANTIFTYENSPLFNQNGKENKHTMPSFDISVTNFVRDGTSLADLKGVTLNMFVADAPSWSYTNSSGKSVSEWDWFKELNSELGLNIKFTINTPSAGAAASHRYITVGKQLDILYASGTNMLQNLCMSRNLTDLININDRGSSPGVCKKTMDGYIMSGGYRIIAPIGNVDVLWQNVSYDNPVSSYAQMWRSDKWDYEMFYRYVSEFSMNPRRVADVWACTNGYCLSKVDTGSPVPTIANNWGASHNLEHIKDVANLLHHTDTKYTKQADMFSFEYNKFYKGGYELVATNEPMTDHTDMMQDRFKIRWVPYPKYNDSPTAKYCAPSLGYGMLLPKKTVNSNNVGAALKFCEIWASRMTESILDNLSLFEYYQFTYDERKEYYEFCLENTVTPLYLDLDLGDDCCLYDILVLDANVPSTAIPPGDIATEWSKVEAISQNHIITKMKEYSN